MSILSEKFKNPPHEFSPCPFWFWNDELSFDEIDRQMAEFRDKGIDAFTVHARQGLPEDIGYMTERWLDFVEYAVKRADETGMTVFLYDEAAYPSGSCCGAVVADNPEYAARGLFMRESGETGDGEKVIHSEKIGDRRFFFIEGYTYGTIRGVFPEQDDGQSRAPRASDLLNPRAVDSFIRHTHDKYYQRLGAYFGGTVKAIFTDEPSLTGRCSRTCRPWTGNFLGEFTAAGLQTRDLYFLFAETDSERGKYVNSLYDELVHARLKRVYYGKLSEWCHKHGIMLSGHPEGSADIGLLSDFDIPGQDIVWRYIYPGNASCTTGVHSTMGKCAADAARHAGKRRNLNECFGACGHPDDPHAFTRDDMKWYIDWLAVRGCNLFVPHAFFYSMRDFRKDERPPDVGMSRSYWQEYKDISDYISRVCFMNTDIVNLTDTAILCKRNDLSWQAAKPLIENQIEFNYLEESLLPNCVTYDGQLRIAKQSYRVIIVPGSFCESTERTLSALAHCGIRIIRFDPDMSDEEYLMKVRLSSRTVTDIGHDKNLRLTRFLKGGEEFVLLTNEGEGTINTQINENVAEIWDAQKAEISSAPWGDCLRISIPRRTSLYLRVKKTYSKIKR